jgi:twitching motility two-component system response regulator PilG
MNELPVDSMESLERSATYSVAVIGFSQTERLVLGSIFRLSARRNPRFVPFISAEHKAPDAFLVDADDECCQAYLKAIGAKSRSPILLVGSSARGTNHLLMPRPLQWTRTLRFFDDGMRIFQSKPMAPRKTDRVLVVDDSLSVRKFMEAKLAPFGFDVDYAESGEQAIGFTAGKRYACVFLDVILPGMDGYQVCKVIKSAKSTEKPTAVVMLTSRSSPFDRIRGTMAGCDAYLTKPVDEEKLLEAIARYLPARQLEMTRV